MKVLFLQKRAGKAGAQVCLYRTVKALVRDGVGVKVLLGEEGWLMDELEKINALCGVIPFPSMRSPISKLVKMNRFNSVIEEVWNRYGPFDVINANDVWEALLAERLAKRWHVPWVIHLRCGELDKAHYYKYHCNSAYGLVAVSPMMYDMVKVWHHMRLEYIPEGIEKEEFYSPVTKDKDFPENVAVIGHSGSKKGWLDLVKGFNRMREEKDILPRGLYFIGRVNDNSVREKIRRILPDSIDLSFTGHIDNLKEVIREFDLVIAPSRRESFGMATIETIAAGVPVIASNTGIIPYLVGEDSGWTFLPGNPEDFTRTWRRLPSLWKERLSSLDKWQQRLKEEFLIDTLNGKLVNLYRGILRKGI